jgi:hypothetical protein
MPGTPREAGPAFVRTNILTVGSTAADFSAATLQTIIGGTAGFSPGFWCYIETIRLVVGSLDFTGTGPLNFELRRDSATGVAVATLSIALANATRGSVLDGTVLPASDAQARIRPTDKLFLVRTATGAAFSAGEGTWSIIARQKLQSRGA